jgi:hypothetical protein
MPWLLLLGNEPVQLPDGVVGAMARTGNRLDQRV